MKRILAVVIVVTAFAAFAEAPPTPPPAAPPEVLPDQQALANGPTAQVQSAPDTTPTVPPGQWVYTSQYGWVYMPYGDAYASVPATGTPSMYVYTANVGWGWVSSPWLLGVGPALYFGTSGYGGYRWYGRPRWWTTYRPARVFAHSGPGWRVNGGRYHGAHAVGFGGGFRGGGFHGGGFHGGGHR